MYLNTLTLAVGSRTFLLSEFTALDRMHDLKYVADLPTMDVPEDDASNQEKTAYGLYREEITLDQVSHSIALSLAHNVVFDDGLSHCEHIASLQVMVKEQWPNKKVNEAYEKLTQLNDPNFEPEPDGVTTSEEEVTPEKP